MGRIDSPALKGTWLGRLLGAWNPIMKRLLTSPLHWPLSRWFAVIEWTGRKSGNRYATPVAYLSRDNETWLTTGDRWWRNLAERPNVRIWVRGARRDGLAEPVVDQAESVRLHATMFLAKPFFARLAGLPAEPTTSEIEQTVRAGRVLVRVSLDPDRSTDP
jgi:deazaflavin-dependent oxidoreductase (nitroreductase family)